MVAASAARMGWGGGGSCPAHRQPPQPQPKMRGAHLLCLCACAAAPLTPPTTRAAARAPAAGGEVVASCPDPTGDCSAALQKAIDTPGAATVRVPALPGGRPWLIADAVNNSALKLGPSSSHRTILFEPGVVVHAMAGAFHQGVLVEAVNATNLTLSGYGATWLMRKADYADPTKYNHSEDRHALTLRGCSHFRVLGLSIRSSGGDGIYMTGISARGNDNVAGYCKEVRIEDVVTVTADGMVNWTVAPRTVGEIESVMAGGAWPPEKDEAPWAKRMWEKPIAA